MTSRNLLVLAVSAVLTGAFAGCGPEGPPETPPEPEAVEHLREDFTELAQDY